MHQKIKEARKNKGLTLEQLAKKVDSSKSYMWQLETEPKIKPSVQLISKIAEALDVTVDYLIDPKKEKMDADQEAIVFYRGFKDFDDTSKKMIKEQIEYLRKLQKK